MRPFSNSLTATTY